jgi:hypothetical protein
MNLFFGGKEMITHKIAHQSDAFDSLVKILEKHFDIHVYEDIIAAPDRSFLVSNKPISDPSSVFELFYSGEKK